MVSIMHILRNVTFFVHTCNENYLTYKYKFRCCRLCTITFRLIIYVEFGKQFWYRFYWVRVWLFWYIKYKHLVDSPNLFIQTTVKTYTPNQTKVVKFQIRQVCITTVKLFLSHHYLSVSKLFIGCCDIIILLWVCSLLLDNIIFHECAKCLAIINCAYHKFKNQIGSASLMITKDKHSPLNTTT